MKNLLFILLIISHILGYSQNFEVPNSPTVSGVGGIGVIWNNYDNGYASDNNRVTTENMTSGENSQFVGYVGFGFSIPTDKIIVGISVEIEKSINIGSGKIRDLTVQLTKDGVNFIGNNLAKTTSNWPLSDTYVEYGSPTDLWGTTWTPNEINSSNFGIIIRVKKHNPLGIRRARIDHVRITVYYE